MASLEPTPQNDAKLNSYHFDHITPSEEAKEAIEACRADYKQLLSKLLNMPRSRTQALAITHLETSLMYATKSLVVDDSLTEDAQHE